METFENDPDSIIISLLYAGFEKFEGNKIKTSHIILCIENYINTYRPDINIDLKSFFDPTNSDPLLEYEPFHSIMMSWFKCVREPSESPSSSRLLSSYNLDSVEFSGKELHETNGGKYEVIQKISSLEDQVTMLIEEKRSLEAKLINFNDLEKQLKETKLKFEEVSANAEIFINQVENLTTQQERLTKENKKLEEKMVYFQEKFLEEGQTKDDLKEELKEMEVKYFHTLEEKKILENRISEYSLVLRERTSELDSKVTELQILQVKLEQINKEKSKLSQQVEWMSSRMEEEESVVTGNQEHNISRNQSFANCGEPLPISHELRSTLIKETAFPSPLRDKELEFILREETSFKTPNHKFFNFSNHNSLKNNYHDSQQSPPSNNSFQNENPKEQLKEETINNMGKMIEQMEKADPSSDDYFSLKSAVEREIGEIMEAKLKADLNYMKIKNEFEQKIENLDSAQSSLNETINELKVKLQEKEEEFEKRGEELEKNDLELRLIREELRMWREEMGEFFKIDVLIDDKIEELDWLIKDNESFVKELEENRVLKEQDMNNNKLIREKEKIEMISKVDEIKKKMEEEMKKRKKNQEKIQEEIIWHQKQKRKLTEEIEKHKIKVTQLEEKLKEKEDKENKKTFGESAVQVDIKDPLGPSIINNINEEIFQEERKRNKSIINSFKNTTVKKNRSFSEDGFGSKGSRVKGGEVVSLKGSRRNRSLALNSNFVSLKTPRNQRVFGFGFQAMLIFFLIFCFFSFFLLLSSESYNEVVIDTLFNIICKIFQPQLTHSSLAPI